VTGRATSASVGAQGMIDLLVQIFRLDTIGLAGEVRRYDESRNRSMDWFKGQITGKPIFSLKPIH
jgi:hypothetical protein